MLLPKIYFSMVTFKNHIAIIQFLINHSVKYLLTDLVAFNKIPDSTIYMYETPYLTKSFFKIKSFIMYIYIYPSENSNPSSYDSLTRNIILYFRPTSNNSLDTNSLLHTSPPIYHSLIFHQMTTLLPFFHYLIYLNLMQIPLLLFPKPNQ